MAQNERRLIDANELMTNAYRLDEQQKTDVWHTSDIEYLVMAQPTVDAVEVVRCKGCEKQRTCRYAQYLGEDGFCSYGERKDK